jgi:signal transduction histidine kinase
VNGHDSRSSAWNVAPLTLVVVALIGSVVIPARQTWRISALLHGTTQVLAPARVLTTELHGSLAEELTPLRSYAIAGDTAALRRFRVIADSNDRRLDSLTRLGARLDTGIVRRIARLQAHMDDWRRFTRATLAQAGGGAALRRAVSPYDSALAAVRDVSAGLATVAIARDDEVSSLEEVGLSWNVILVIAAFAALSGVMILTVRERRALRDAEVRSRREAELRELAELLAGSFTMDQVTRTITDAARRVFGGQRAWFERRVADPSAASSTCLTVPLGDAESTVGVLMVEAAPDRPFTADDARYASTFGHLASLAIQKIRVLQDASEGRQRLERVLKSRSRLIRGFSHDVKNPIGAADGYAALLHDGIYGDLTATQLESVNRIRRSIHGALSLIGDLHELASAETGHLTLTIEPVNLAEMIHGMIDDYRGSASAAGLDLREEIDSTVTIVAPNGTRVQQILSNLLSNAIKYTPRGSVVVRLARGQRGPFDQEGDWLRLDVADTGPGIPVEKREFIFEEFSRIAPRNEAGAGLGLAISRLLAQALGGHISLESVVGAGSTFTLWLPGTSPAPDERREAVRVVEPLVAAHDNRLDG